MLIISTKNVILNEKANKKKERCHPSRGKTSLPFSVSVWGYEIFISRQISLQLGNLGQLMQSVQTF